MEEPNTHRTNGFTPHVSGNDGEYVILLDWLEFWMSKAQFKRIKDKWNDGIELEEIAENEKRNALEVLFALMHQAAKENKLRPFAGRL
ncbi:hypothetical protein CVR97_28090 [Salmonella enterica subsp. enterica serovar Typhimurium]|uniref:hypothetical protein n=1 Tax=Salmonella enterica TaxID=28901 RepID=UPI000C21F218|nr:hypothetical protein [Salmonella enterica]PJH58750.1 hypothetical protein CVR97_28090 [Salmonella enterica subsp. enterica serovar Typhimurium]